MKDFPRLFMIFSHIPIMVTMVYAIVNFKRFTKKIKIVSYFICVSALTQFISLGMWFKRQNNLPLLHVYIIFQVLLLAWFYNNILADYINKKILKLVALLFCIFSMLNSIFIQHIFSFNTYAITASSILITIVSIFTFSVLMNDIVKRKIKTEISSLNWINSGLFIYHSSSLLIFFIDSEELKKTSEDLNLYTWMLHSFFSIVMYLCFFVGLKKAAK